MCKTGIALKVPLTGREWLRLWMRFVTGLCHSFEISRGPIMVNESLTTLQVKRTGVIPPEHYSHDHLNEQKDVPIDRPIFEHWREVFTKVDAKHRNQGEQISWVLVDGFLLYWHPVCCSERA